MKITNGLGEIFEVSKGAYEDIYSKQGFKPYDKGNYGKKVKVSNQGQNDASNDASDDDKFLESIQEKPIAQWNKTEVKKFAALKGIDITGTKNANEAKAIIKEFLETQEEEEVVGNEESEE